MPKKSTLRAVMSICAADAEIDRRRIRKALRVLDGTENVETPTIVAGTRRLLRREEVAALLGKSEKTIDLYGRNGMIKRTVRGCYTAESVLALMNGGVR